jgi:cysteine desulfurase
MIYLDHNATTPVDSRVKEEVLKALDIFGNPSSSHLLGRKAKYVLEMARQKVAELIGADPSEIVFTSGGTESNNLALIGYILNFRQGHIITTMIEHPSIMKTVLYLKQKGYSVTLLRPEQNGRINPEDVKKALRPDTVLVSIMHSNNETGVIQPIEEIAGIVKDSDAVFHTDAAQSIGKVEVNVDRLGVDMLTIVSHKFYGPKGIGALYIRKGVKVNPILHGGGQERGVRPGTESIPLIAGLGKAAELSLKELPDRKRHLQSITETLWKGLRRMIPDITLNGENAPRLPNTLNISIRGIIGAELVQSLSEEVAISAGSACHEGRCTPSEVLTAMGLTPEEALSSVRISTGKDTTVEQVNKATFLISEKISSLQKSRSKA